MKVKVRPHSGWMLTALLSAICFSALAPALPRTVAQSPNASSSKSDRALESLFSDYHEQYMAMFPLEATAFGDPRFNDSLTIRISPDFLAKEEAFYKSTLDRLHAIERSEASDALRLAADILEYEMKTRLEGLPFHSERIPWNQFDGLPLSFGQLGSGVGNQPFKSVKDYENWLKRVAAFEVWMNVAIDQFKQGLADKYVMPTILVKRMIEQCRAPSILSKTPEECLFYGPIERLPSDFSAADKQRLTAAYRDAITKSIQPAYQRMGDFLEKEYLPHTRSTSGISALARGNEYYQYCVRNWTTTSLSPDEIFAIGQAEVKRIRAEMESVQKQMGFQGTLDQFFEFLRSDPQFTPYQTPEQVLAAYHEIHRRLEPNVDKIFRGKPKTPFEIRRTEAFREKTASAEYNPGSADGSRPGIFYVPIPDAKTFNVTSGMESLFLHEAIPGHHYQISLQQENQSIPQFCRFLWYGAYGEGWALYCESLGSELGMYVDPKQKMGALGDEMHRAIRLVVDVGMHWKGWTANKHSNS